MKTFIIIFVQLFLLTISALAQSEKVQPNSKLNIFVGYDLGQMAFNKFQNFAGEIGLKTKKDHMIRIAYQNVKLTEAHLSSSFGRAVDGDNVTGLWHGYGMLYDIPVFRLKNGKGFAYGGLAAGYHKNSYQHTILDESFEHKTTLVGFDIGFRENDIFKVKGLYINLSIPFLFNLNKIEETKLGDTTINSDVLSQSIAFFVGYEF